MSHATVRETNESKIINILDKQEETKMLLTICQGMMME